MANTISSKTGTVSSNTVTFLIPGNAKKVNLYVDYDKGDGTSASLTLASKNPQISSDAYTHAAFATADVSAITLTFTATGRFRFEIPVSVGENELIATVSFTGGTTQEIICDHYIG